MKYTSRATTGRRLAMALALLIALAASSAFGQAKMVSLNFAGADIAIVLKALADASGANIVVAPEVKGPVTVKLTNVTTDEAITSIVKMTNFDYRLLGATYLISTREALNTDRGEMTSAIIVPKGLALPDAEVLVSGAFKAVAVKAANNRLILAGPSREVQAARGFIEDLDTMIVALGGVAGGPAKDGYSLLELKVVTPADAESAVALAYKDVKTKTLPPNRLLLLGPDARLRDVKAFIETFDVPSGAGGNQKTGVVALSNLGAEDALAVLSMVHKQLRVTAFADKKRIAITGTPEQVDAAVAYIKTVDVPAPTSETMDDSRPYKLKGLATADAQAALGVAFKDVRTQVLPGGYLLLVGATPRLELASTFLSKIDGLVPAQVVADDREAIRVVKVAALGPQEVVAAIGTAYKDVRATAMPVDRVLLVGPARRMDEVEAFVKTIDVDQGKPAGDAYRIVTLMRRSPAEVEAAVAGPFADVKVKSVPGGNCLVISGPAQRLEAADKFIQALDALASVAADAGPEVVDVYALKGLAADSAEQTITVAFKNLRAKAMIGNRLVLVGPKSQVADARKFLAAVDADPAPVANAPAASRTVITAKYLSPEDAKAALMLAFKDVQVAALSNGQLVLSGAPQLLTDAKAFLADLDKPKLGDSPAGDQLVLSPAKLTADDAVAAVSTGFPDLKVKALTGGQIILSGAPRQLAGAKALVEMLDAAAKPNALENFLYRPQAMTPQDIATVLGATFADVKVASLSGGQLLISGTAARVQAAREFLTKADVGAPIDTMAADKGWIIVEIKALPAQVLQDAIALAYKDVTFKPLTSGSAMLIGPKARLDEAKGLLARIDVSAPVSDVPQVKLAETPYRVKARVPWQLKEYLESQYRAQGLAISYLPNIAGRSGANPMTPAAAGATWQSDELLLRGPDAVVKAALDTLAAVDAAPTMAEARCGAKRVFATEAINYLLERFEGAGLIVITAPRTATGASAVNPAIGVRVLRDTTGKLNVAEPIGDFIVRGPEDVVAAAQAALTGIDIGPDRGERLCTVRFVKAADVKKQLEDSFGARGLTVGLGPAKIAPIPAGSVSAADMAQAEIVDLILAGPEDIMALAMQRVQILDREPLQVDINTEIISLNSSDVSNLGVTWGAPGTPGALNVGLKEAMSGDPLKFGRVVRSPLDLSAAINALQSKSRAKIVSRPRTTVQVGREAFIHVGDQIALETVSGFTDKGPVFTTTTLDTGVRLQVTPMASEDGLVTLSITIIVTQPPTIRKSANGGELPTVTTAESRTVVKIRSGETLAIGGLMQTQDSVTRTKIPLLGDIPLIGRLFSSRKTEPAKSELLILVTPTVLPTSAQVTAATTIQPTR